MTNGQMTQDDSQTACPIALGESGFLSFEEATVTQINPETGLSDRLDLADSYFRVADVDGGFEIERIAVPTIGRGESVELGMAEIRGLMLKGHDSDNMVSDHPNYSDSRFAIVRINDGYTVTRFNAAT